MEPELRPGTQSFQMSIPVLSVAAMRDWEERSWSEGIDPWDVIAQVGKKLAARYLSSSQAGDSLLLLAGPGHNGDDVRAMVPWLFQRRVELLSVNGKPEDLIRLETHLAQGPDAVIEGLFGIGLNRPLEGVWASIVEVLNRFSGPVISVDVPSGLASTGDGIIGPVVQARETWTIGALKETLLKTHAGAVTGRLVLLKDVGLNALEPRLSELHAYDPHDAVGFPPPRPAHAHKGSQGWVGILGGGAGYHGAAVLAARGAASAQPGLIRLWVPPSVYDPVASRLEHVMVESWAGEDSLPGKLTCLVAGPGMASKEWTQETFDTLADAWLNRPIAMVVDASALDRLPAGKTVEAPRVITPHPGEAARMLSCTVAEVEADRLQALRALSDRYGGSLVVLKGHHTLVGQAQGRVTVHLSGNPYLAQGGAGDVLAGWLGGLLAQPALQTDVLRTLCYGVWRHGAAADTLEQEVSGWTPDRLPSRLAG